MVEGSNLHKLITELAKISSHPRRVCVRFARRMGFEGKRSYREWSEREIADLRRLHTTNTPRVLAGKLNRPEASVRAMLRRLGITSRIEEDRFTKYTLASLVHVRPEVIQEWIDRRWLKAHREGTEKLPRLIIKAKDFIQFSKRHHDAILRRRVNEDRLEVFCKFVCPPEHAKLLEVRDHKKARTAHFRQMDDQNRLSDSEGDLENQPMAEKLSTPVAMAKPRRKAARAS